MTWTAGPPAFADLGPDLVTLQEAATYLRVVLSPAQPDVTSDLTVIVHNASTRIRRHLKERNDPAWDETSAPGDVRDAVFMYLANRWEHKGDDLAPNNNEAAVWQAITDLLNAVRDPSIA